jgi:hypothetical protein
MLLQIWEPEMSKPSKEPNQPVNKTVTLPCGCAYQDKGWLLTRVKECEYHKRKRTSKRPYRPKAECVRP